MSNATPDTLAQPSDAMRLSPSQLLTFALCLVIAGYAAILVSGIGQPESWLIDDKGRPAFTDFAALWGAGHLALEGRAIAAYDWAAHAEAMSIAMGRPAQQFPFAYPPTFLAIIAPFAALPYITSLALWIGATLALYLYAAARIAGRWEAAIWIGAMIVTLGNIIAGQNGFLTAGLMGLGLLMLHDRPVLAGILLGALAYKPHLGLLLPVALAAAGCWRAFASAAATVIASALAATALFGLEPWAAFVDGAARFSAEIITERFSVTNKLQSAYGFLATLGMPKGLAMAAQLALLAALIGSSAWIWRSPAPHALKAAFLVTASALMSPYVYVYDLTLLAIAQAFLLRHWLATGFDKREAIILLAVNTLVVLMITIKIPMGFLASLFLLAAILDELRANGTARPTSTA